MFPVLTLQSLLGFLALWWVVSGVSSSSVIAMRGTLGRPVTLSLEPPMTGLAEEVTWNKGNVLVGKMKRSVGRNGIQGHKNTSYIFPNGTLWIYKMGEGDTGNYTAAVYSASGVNIYTTDFLLESQEPVDTRSDGVTSVTLSLGVCIFLGLDLQAPAQVIWKNGDRTLGSNDALYQEATEGVRAHVMANGTLRLCETALDDQGEYTADVVDRNGKVMHRKVYHLQIYVDPKNSYSGNTWGSFALLILSVASVALSTVSILFALLWCVMRKKKKPEPVLEVITYQEFRLRNPIPDDPVETEEKSKQDEGISWIKKEEATGSADEDHVSARSAEAGAEETEQVLLSNVSTFQTGGE